jgi:hypothetical protein
MLCWLRAIARPTKAREKNKVAYDPKRALELLRIGSGRADATFRDGQEDAIRHIVEGKGRLLVVQKTGWGKSFVYFIATKLLREAGAGPALLISPLLALMRNQIAAAERMGVRAATINSDNMDDWTAVEGKLANGEIDILLISPERLANDALPHPGVGGYRRTDFHAGHRRSALHFRLGARLPPSLPAAGAHRQDLATQSSAPCYYGDGEQQGDG